VEVRDPLYEGGRVDAATREALARVSSAEQQLEAARREIDRDTRANWARARANHARIDSTLLEVGAMEQTVLAQERGVELGASRVIDLLDARRRLIKARGDHAKARYDFVRDVVNLKASSGELTLAAIAVWDRWFDAAPR
jgi:outer membrane protein